MVGRDLHLGAHRRSAVAAAAAAQVVKAVPNGRRAFVRLLFLKRCRWRMGATGVLPCSNWKHARIFFSLVLEGNEA